MEAFSSHESGSDESAMKKEIRASETSGDDQFSLHESGAGEGAMKEEIGTSESSGDDDQRNKDGKIAHQVASWKRSQDEDECKVQDQLQSMRIEIDGIIEENQRLKMYLDRILKDYRALQMQYHRVAQQEMIRKCPNTDKILDECHAKESISEPIDLNLRMNFRDENVKKENEPITAKNTMLEGDSSLVEGFTLGINCESEKTKNSSNYNHEDIIEGVKEEETEQTLKSKEMSSMRDGDEISQPNLTKRARVSIRVRCDFPTTNDGCQWRKYGQKISKGNPCPRAYYRCTVAQSCPVRKQVQRCAEDLSILITTYEGTHNHPLPASAKALASATSAAAEMLLSGSSSSDMIGSTSTITSHLHGQNLFLQNPFVSSSYSCPTITLDLTSNSSSPFLSLNRSNIHPNRLPTTTLNFNSIDSNSSLPHWAKGKHGNGSQPQLYDKKQDSFYFGPQQTLNNHKPYLQRTTLFNPSQLSLPRGLTIAAATKGIMSNPNFQSALAEALTSIIATSGIQSTLGESSSSSVKNGKESVPFPILSSFPFSAPNDEYKCTSTTVNNLSPSTASQHSGVTSHSPTFPFPDWKSSQPDSSSSGKRD